MTPDPDPDPEGSYEVQYDVQSVIPQLNRLTDANRAVEAKLNEPGSTC